MDFPDDEVAEPERIADTTQGRQNDQCDGAAGPMDAKALRRITRADILASWVFRGGLDVDRKDT